MENAPLVERTALGALTISRVVTGLWQVADMERGGQPLDLDAAAAAMLPYTQAGLTTFDMADHYGSAEEIVGRFRQAYPEHEVELLTKWVPEPGPVSRQEVRGAVERALSRMQSDRLELLQFHAWNYADPSWLDSLFYLQELQDEGLIGELGLTNFDSAHLRVALASGLRVVSNQVCVSLLDRRALGAMTALCREYGVKLLAYGTVAGGFLSEGWLGRPDPGLEGLSTWSQLKYYRFIEAAGGWAVFQGLLATLAELARARGASVATLASRYALEQEAVGAAIIGARLARSAHIGDTLKLFTLELDAACYQALGEALGALLPIPGDSGDEYRKPPFLTASGDLSDHLREMPPPYPVETGADGRRRVLSGTPWESLGGYCRALRVEGRVLVSGTTATHRDRLIGGRDAGAQFHAAADKLEGALQSLGARLEDVVRTRVFVRNLADWEAVARAHGARFATVMPANTLVQAELVGEDYLVELEAEAIVA